MLAKVFDSCGGQVLSKRLYMHYLLLQQICYIGVLLSILQLKPGQRKVKELAWSRATGTVEIDFVIVLFTAVFYCSMV